MKELDAAKKIKEIIVDESATASTIVKRNSSGDVNVRLIRQTYQNESSMSGGLVFRKNVDTDNYLRVCSDPTAVRSWIDAAPSNHSHSYLPLTGGTMTGKITTSATTGTYLSGNQSGSLINSTASAGTYTMLFKYPSTNGYFTTGGYQGAYLLNYTNKATVDAGTNSVTKSATLLDENGNSIFPGTVTAANFSGSISGNATTASALQTARMINGTSFNGSSNITTVNWGTERIITIGNMGKSVNGSSNVSWSLSEIGAAAASHGHSYLPLSGGTLTGGISVNGESKFYSEKYSDPWQGISCAIKAAGHIATTGTLKSSALNVGAGGIDIESRIMQTRANEALYLYTAGKSEGVGFDYQGYVRPQGDSTWSCGHPSWRWSIVYAQSGVSTGSDGKWKKHIKYIVSEEELNYLSLDYPTTDYSMSTYAYEGDSMNTLSPVLSSSSSDKVNEFTKDLYGKDITLDITTNDLYDFFKDDFILTSYRYDVDMYHGNDKRNNELNNVGFIAQDVVNTKVGKLFIIEPEDDELATKEEKGYTYNLQNYISIIAGAFKSSINEIENLKAEIKKMKSEIEFLKNK